MIARIRLRIRRNLDINIPDSARANTVRPYAEKYGCVAELPGLNIGRGLAPAVRLRIRRGLDTNAIFPAQAAISRPYERIVNGS